MKSMRRLTLISVLFGVLSLGCSDDSTAGDSDGGTEDGSASQETGSQQDTGGRQDLLLPDVEPLGPNASVLFLHHSTGGRIWQGGVADWFGSYNSGHSTSYSISEREFPQADPYGWENYPYDYWNIWVNHAGDQPYLQEPTLELLSAQYDVIVFKHCFPVSDLEADSGGGDVSDPTKTQANYRLQYAALKQKLRSFPETVFILWTGAARIQSETDQAQATRAREFFSWVKQEWDEAGDNIYLWDFHQLQTEGGLYFKDEYSDGDSHPGPVFSERVAPLFGQRVVNVIEGQGDATSLTGE